jgi:glycosyltransferase involved in cell wall biosynthesis
MKVVITQRVLPHYRIPFFIKLQQSLKNDNIDLFLIYGQEQPGTVPRTVELNQSWAIRITNRYIKLPFGGLTWQPCWHTIQDADLVIIEQANRLAINYRLQFLWRNPKHKLAFWGHGTNFQSKNIDSFDNKVKRYLAKKVDWWFAYTDMAVFHLNLAKFPRDKVTVVQNCIDTTDLNNAAQKITHEDLTALRQKLGLTSQHIGLYCGGLYSDKRIDFLLAACDNIKAKVPDFECIIIGDGPDSKKVREATANRDWLHYTGPLFGTERVPYFLLSRVLLMPGLVGLVIIDSFATQLPLFTTYNGIHSPEIAYLENGINGFMTVNTLDDYVNAVVKGLTDDVYLQHLQQGCALSAEKYTLDNMVNNFATGIRQCLAKN